MRPVLELRVDEGEGGPTISGYAAVFNALSEDLGGFREEIQPGTFKRTLSENADVRALWNHNPDMVLGRTRAKTLELWEDDRGLAFRIQVPDTQLGRDALVSIQRGDVDQMSFGFYTQQDRWAQDEGGNVLRTLVDVDLVDVSPVTFPAYPQTSAQVRSQAAEMARKRTMDLRRKRLDLLERL